MALLGRGTELDQEVLESIVPLVDALWSPLRFLADLRSVWADLDLDERGDIEGSHPYRERFHERLAAGYVEELLDLSQQIRTARYRGLRDELSFFLESWDEQEPDKLKILSALIQKELREG